MTEIAEPGSQSAVERRIVSVLFADLVGFTSLSEQLDAEDIAIVQDAYFSSVRSTVERYGGVLEKFIGDAAMAVFGAPRARDDDAERAVRAGLALIGAVEQLAARVGLDSAKLELRVGVNTGEVVHATEGPDAGRVTGDTVNTAARLQAASDPNRVLIGELTALAVHETIELSERGAILLKGKAEPTRVWVADGVRAKPSRDAAMGELRAPMLGRQPELARLAAIGSGIHLVVAAPGVGKSRLLAELARERTAAGVLVLRARVRPQATGPYEAVAQLLTDAGVDRLDAALEASDTASGRRSVIRTEVAGLLQPLAAGSSVVQPAVEPEARFAAWCDAIEILAGNRPAVWLVEDVHWAGPDLLGFLSHASLRPRTGIVCTARPSIHELAPAWTATVDEIELEPLAATDAGDLVRALVGDALPDPFVAAIVERSDGTPLFIEELLRGWSSAGVLERDGDAWRLTVAPDRVSLPATVQAIYSAQLDDLPPDARLVARRASVAGRRFPEAAFGPLELKSPSQGLEMLRRRAFVDGPLRDPMGDAFAFRHALLRDVGYASLARAERSRLHLALARWLEQGAGERQGEVAQLIGEHYASALESLPALGEHGRDAIASATATWFERAAATAVAAAAPGEAIRLLTRSIELTQTGVDRARRLARRGGVMAETDDLESGIADLAAGLEALEASLPEQQDLYAETAYALGRAYMQQIRFAEAAELMTRALERVSEADAPAGFARLLALRAWARAARGETDGSIRAEADRARAMAAGVGDPALELEVLEHWAAAGDETGDPGEPVWAEIAERARSLGRWRQVVSAGRVAANLVAERDPRQALDLLDELADVAGSRALTEQGGWIDLARAETLMVAGDWDDALVAAEHAIAAAERFAYERLGFRTWVVAFPILAARRSPDWLPRYEVWWSTLESHFPSTIVSAYGQILSAAIPLWIARAQDLPLPLPGQLPEPLPPISNPHILAAREIIAEALLEHGELDALDRANAWEPEPDWSPLMLASRELVLAWMAQSRGEDPTPAAERAIALLDPLDAPWWRGRALLLTGEAARGKELLAGLGVPA